MSFFDYAGALFNFIVIITILFLVFSAPVMLPKIVRSYRLKLLAKKLNLDYKSKFWSDFSFDDMPDHMERNVMEGTLKGKKIKIYDSFDINKSISNPFWPTNFYGKNSSSPYTRKTFIEVDSKKDVIHGSFFIPFAHFSEIRKRLESIG